MLRLDRWARRGHLCEGRRAPFGRFRASESPLRCGNWGPWLALFTIFEAYALVCSADEDDCFGCFGY